MIDHPIEGLMKTAMENLKEMVDVNTIIGDPVETSDGTVILPVSKVGFGYAAGGSDFSAEGKRKGEHSSQVEQHPFGGGSGGGVSITPIAFLVVGKGEIKLVHIDTNTHLYEKLFDFTPKILDKIQSMRQNDRDDKCYPNSQNEKPLF